MAARVRQKCSSLLSLVISLNLLASACPCPALAVPRLKFSGAIIRYDSVSQKLTREQWLQVLEAISSLSIKTIVIKYHHFVPRQNSLRAPASELDFLPASAGKAAAATTAVAPTSTTAKTLATLTTTKTTAKTVAKTPSKTGPAPTATPPLVDATGIILDFADSHEMNVYMGLWMDQSWYSNLDVLDQLAHNLNRSKIDLVQLQEELTSKKADSARTALEIKNAEAEIAVCKRGLLTVQDELEEKSLYFAASKDGPMAGPSLAIADSLSRLYGEHPSFVGWYLPEEIWDAAFSRETISVLNPLLRFICRYCRESGKQKRHFALSPYASRLHYDSVGEIETAQKELLKDTGIDVLMLQDSIGDLNLKEDEDIAVRLKKHFTAFSKVASSLNMRLWAELESFSQVAAARKPTNIARLKKQFQYTYPYLDKTNPVFVIYDYLHFFSLTDSGFPYPEERAKLYDDYKREFVDSPFTPEAEKIEQ